jgi:serine/threonine-protein kinase
LPGWLKSLLKIAGILVSLLATAAVATYITVRVLVPAESIAVPDVVGRDITDAITRLSEAELGTKVVGRRFVVQVPADTVVSQAPPPGTKVQANRCIEVVVSAGSEVVVIPDLVGMKLREAIIHLSRVGVEAVTTSQVFADVDRDVVLAQNPETGTTRSREEQVALLVSMGPRSPDFMMPDLIGWQVAEVADLLESSSLSIAMIKEEPSTEPEGFVIQQLPAAGSLVGEDSRVELVVSAGAVSGDDQMLSERRWVYVFVQIPYGFDPRRVRAVVVDEDGTRQIDLGLHAPGTKVPISCEVVGEAEVRVYLDDELVKVKEVSL